MFNLSGITSNIFSSTMVSNNLVMTQPINSKPLGLLYYIDYHYETITEQRMKKLKKVFGEDLKELKDE